MVQNSAVKSSRHSAIYFSKCAGIDITLQTRTASYQLLLCVACDMTKFQLVFLICMYTCERSEWYWKFVMLHQNVRVVLIANLLHGMFTLPVKKSFSSKKNNFSIQVNKYIFIILHRTIDYFSVFGIIPWLEKSLLSGECSLYQYH